MPDSRAGGDPLRKQYHFWRSTDSSSGGRDAWDVDRLIALAASLPRLRIPVDAIHELDEVYWFDEEQHPTCRKVLEHLKLIEEAELAYPIILAADGRVMDGMHRVAKAALRGQAEIVAVRFERTPEPDYTDCHPSELPYDKSDKANDPGG